jgi:hypothetical protein
VKFEDGKGELGLERNEDDTVDYYSLVRKAVTFTGGIDERERGM